MAESKRRMDGAKDRVSRVAASWKPARSMRASEDVAAQIVESFYTQNLKPGEWIGTEAELGATFNVSRITIRDAVRALEARGLIDVRVGVHGGLRVAQGDPDKLVDAFSIQLRLLGVTAQELNEAMVAIEPLSAGLAAERCTDEDIARLHELLNESRALMDQPVEFVRSTVEFHQAVVDASGNRALHALVGALRFSELAHLAPPATRDRALNVVATHTRILEAIEARDASEARERMLQHLGAIGEGARRANAQLTAAV